MQTRTILDMDSWTTDPAPIELRLAGKRWIVAAPDFESAVRVAEAIEQLDQARRTGELTLGEYVDRLSDVLLAELRFIGVPDWWARWALRRTLRGRPRLYRLRALEELSNSFLASLRQQFLAVTEGRQQDDGEPPTETGSPMPSPASATGSLANSPADGFSGGDSGGSPVRRNG